MRVSGSGAAGGALFDYFFNSFPFGTAIGALAKNLFNLDTNDLGQASGEMGKRVREGVGALDGWLHDGAKRSEANFHVAPDGTTTQEPPPRKLNLGKAALLGVGGLAAFGLVERLFMGARAFLGNFTGWNMYPPWMGFNDPWMAQLQPAPLFRYNLGPWGPTPWG